MRCENIVLIDDEEDAVVRDWARGLDAIFVKALLKQKILSTSH
jgi:Rod binding domain-containing protein